MANDRTTGKASYFVFNGVNIPITKYTPKTTRNLPDSTDSGDYNSNTDLICHTRIPVSVDMELSVEGRYRFSVTPSGIMSVLFTGINALPVQLGIDAGHLFGHGLFDLGDFSCDVPIEDIVTFSCTLKLNGIFTPNA